MKVSGIITSFLFFFTSLPLASQQLIFKNYTVEDGLVSNPVRRIYQDARGFLWIGTWEGLSKYDGHKFTNYTTANGLSHNMINDIYESEDGKLLVAENDGTVDVLQRDAIVKKAAFRNVVINQFYLSQDKRLLAASDPGGLYEIKNENMEKPLQTFPGSGYNDLTELNDSLLIAGAEGSLRILNKQFQLFAEIKQSKGILTFKIYTDSKKRVWVGTNDGLKLVSPNQKNNQLFHFTVLPTPFNIPELRNRIVYDMLEDANGNFWIATSHGLVKIQQDKNLPAGRQDWQLFTEKEGLPSSEIWCLFQDKEKNIWIGSIHGLTKLVTKNDISIYTIKNELTSNGIGYLIPLNDESFLTNNRTGVQLFNTKNVNFSVITSQHNVLYPGYVENSLPRLFFSHNKNGFGKYDSVNRRITDYILQDTLISGLYCSVMDANGIIFSGSQKGLIICSRGKSYYENKLPYRISDLLIDKKGYLWAGTWNNGLFRIHYNSKNRSNIPEEVQERISLSVQDFSGLLPDKNVRCLFEDSKGNMWVGTRYQGIIKLKNTTNEPYAVQHFDLRKKLMSNWARVIAEDTKGNIWIGSNLGIDKLIPEDETYQVFNFSRVNNYFAHVNAILPQKNNSLWLATSKGLVNIIDGETEKTSLPPVYITGVTLSDTGFNYTTHKADEKVQLKYNRNYATFEFSAPGFINEKQIVYSYRLLGSGDTAWSQPSNLHNVTYASLPPGNYRFEVRTKDWNEQWGIASNFIFYVQPPYWQTWWFYLLIGILAALLLYGIYLYRIGQIMRLQKVRNRIASDLHDDIGSTLTNINMLSEISRKNLEQPKEAEKFLHRITEEVTATSQALNDIIWSVNSRNDTLQETTSRMRRYAAELFDNSNTILHLNMDENVAGKKLNMEQRRDVYLIYKECMNNIVKHASPNNVWINMHWQNGKLHIQIKDDGRGFDKSFITKGNGLKNIRSRVEKWKGSTTIKTSIAEGTIIEIDIPLAG